MFVIHLAAIFSDADLCKITFTNNLYFTSQAHVGACGLV